MLQELRAEADATDDAFHSLLTRIALAHGNLEMGETAESRRLAEEAVEYGSGLGPFVEMWALAPEGRAALAQGDITAAVEVNDIVAQRISEQPGLGITAVMPTVELAVIRGDLDEARKLADVMVAPMMGWHRGKALTVLPVRMWPSRSTMASRRSPTPTRLCPVLPRSRRSCWFPTTLDVLGELSAAEGRHREAARYGGAAAAIRKRMGGAVRFPLYEPKYRSLFASLRDAMGNDDFDSAWAEGDALSLEEAISYAQRGHGERKRPTTGWASLTPTSSTSFGWSPTGWAIRTSPGGFACPTAPCRRT